MSGVIKSPDPLGVTQKRALVAERLRKAARERRKAPLSFAQQRLWFLDQLEPNSPLYNICAVGRVEGALEVASLELALNALVARHETLRTTFGCEDEIPIQIIDPHRELALPLVDLSDRRSAGGRRKPSD